MNWFEPLFRDALWLAHPLSEAWRLGAILFLGFACASIVFGLRTPGRRLTFAGLFVALWEAGLPTTPLGFLSGRVGGLQDEVLIIFLMSALGLYGICRSLRRPRLHILPLSIAALMIASLSYAYHIVLINGFDGALRDTEAAALARTLDLTPDAWAQYCTLEGHLCGDGHPQTGLPGFDRDLGDWITHALPGDTEGRIWSSDGTLGANPPHIWAAERAGNTLKWIMVDRSLQAKALEFAFFVMASLALAFWSAAALMVECLHRRRPRRSRS